MTRSRNFPLKKRGGRLTGGLVFPQRAEILSTAASSFLDRRVLWRRHHFLVQLHIVRRSPTLVYLLVVAAGAASCHTQELAERFRRTFHAYVQRANTQETKIFLCVFNQSSCYHFAIILSRSPPSNFSPFSFSLFLSFLANLSKGYFFFKN